MATATAPRPTTTDPLLIELMKTEGKAEIVNDEIIEIMPTGGAPNYAGLRIVMALFRYAEQSGEGRAVTDNAGFLCNLPHRRSFSPNAAFYIGPDPGMGFFPEPPVFAVEVRSENDYGPRAEREMAQKRADYFAAGTQVVWDVDLQNEDVVAKYSASEPTRPQIFRRGDEADAEPAVPNWRLRVDDLFAAAS